MKKILFATIVPFWNRETGAQQRIFSLVKVLEQEGHQVRIFFPGHAEQSDRELAQQLRLDIAFHSSDDPLPANKSLGQKIKWQFDAVVHALRGHEPQGPRNTPLTLSDFRWPWAELQFQHAVEDFNPDAIVCEYITMGYLVESLPHQTRSRIHCFVDTHDLLSKREEKFAKNDRAHWINVSPEEEASALNVFDTVIAIQPCEAELMQTMVADKRIIVVGHLPHVVCDANVSTSLTTQNESATLTFGYLGSANDSNTDAINQFLELVWASLKDNTNLTLVIAGKVSERVAGSLRFNNVTLQGHVSDPAEFYDLIDIAINPVQYGTGLKIKSVEAIAYRKPLLCTAAGWAGERVGGVTILDSIKEMGGVIDAWLKDLNSLEKVKSAANASSQSVAQQPYASLLQLLSQL